MILGAYYQTYGPEDAELEKKRKALHDDMSRGQPVLQRRHEANQLIPLLDDEFDIDAAAQ